MVKEIRNRNELRKWTEKELKEKFYKVNADKQILDEEFEYLYDEITRRGIAIFEE